MQKGLGIAALIIAIISLFIPVAGPWLTIVSAVLVAFSFGSGLALALISIVINLINIFFVRPDIWTAFGAADLATSGRSVASSGTILFLVEVLAFIVLMVLHKTKRSH